MTEINGAPLRVDRRESKSLDRVGCCAGPGEPNTVQVLRRASPEGTVATNRTNERGVMTRLKGALKRVTA